MQLSVDYILLVFNGKRPQKNKLEEAQGHHCVSISICFYAFIQSDSQMMYKASRRSYVREKTLKAKWHEMFQQVPGRGKSFISLSAQEGLSSNWFWILGPRPLSVQSCQLVSPSWDCWQGVVRLITAGAEGWRRRSINTGSSAIGSLKSGVCLFSLSQRLSSARTRRQRQNLVWMGSQSHTGSYIYVKAVKRVSRRKSRKQSWPGCLLGTLRQQSSCKKGFVWIHKRFLRWGYKWYERVESIGQNSWLSEKKQSSHD